MLADAVDWLVEALWPGGAVDVGLDVPACSHVRAFALTVRVCSASGNRQRERYEGQAGAVRRDRVPHGAVPAGRRTVTRAFASTVWPATVAVRSISTSPSSRLPDTTATTSSTAPSGSGTTIGRVKRTP